MKLLKRINIVNTTTSNIYKNTNGFPLGIKRISINSNNMQITIDADNLKSTPELEEIEKGKEWQTPEELALEEVRAQVFAAEGIGKGGILWNQISGTVQTMVDEGYRPNTVLNSIVKALRMEDYEVDDDDKSVLWEVIRRRYEERRRRT